MQTQPSFPPTAIRWASRHWLVIAVAAFASIMLLATQPVWAADVRPDLNQTVPPPTPRPTASTPKPDNNKSGGSDGTAATTAPATPAAAAGAAQITSTANLTAVVQAVTLNVRQGPGTSFPVVGKLAQGTVVGIEGRNDAGDWWYVCCIPSSGGRGWISAQLVTPSFAADQAAGLPVTQGVVETAPTTASAAGGKSGSVTALTLNVRSAPSTDSTVLGKLKEGNAISVLGRNETGDWLQVCCVPGSQTLGWVSAQYITPAFTDGELAVAGAQAATTTPAATTTGTITGTTTATAATTDTAAAATGPLLAVAIDQQPPFAVQGKEIALVFTIQNTGSQTAENVKLSNTLPAGLSLVKTSAAVSGTVAAGDGASAVTVTWPSVGPGQSVAATVRVKVASDVADGTAFDNLATVTADNAESASAGITIGMPPSLLPEFW